MSTQNVNVARFARNVEWDFFCDFQTPCDDGTADPPNRLLMMSQISCDFEHLWMLSICGAHLLLQARGFHHTILSWWPLKFCLILRNVFFHKRRKSLGVFTSEGIEHRIASSLGVCEIATEKSFQFWASICISEQLILRESHSSSKWNGYKSDGRRHVEFLPTSCIKSENCLIIQKLQGKQHHKLTL